MSPPQKKSNLLTLSQPLGNTCLLAAVSCSSVPYCTCGVKIGLGLTGKLGHAWVHGSVHGSVHVVCGWCMVAVGKVNLYTTWISEVGLEYAPTHARPRLPVNPNPIFTPPVQYGMGLHDTAACSFLKVVKKVLQLTSPKY